MTSESSFITLPSILLEMCSRQKCDGQRDGWSNELRKAATTFREYNLALYLESQSVLTKIKTAERADIFLPYHRLQLWLSCLAEGGHTTHVDF